MDDESKLTNLRGSDPSNHPDPRMSWTLHDMSRLFSTGPSAKEKPRPGPILVQSNK